MKTKDITSDVLMAAASPIFKLLFALWGLLAWVSPAQGQFPPLLHPTETLWSVWTNGTNPGYGLVPGSPDWAQPGFDDSAWPRGRGLFGNDSGYPYPFQTITPPPGVAVRLYARTHFTWSTSTRNVTLRGTNFVDDGAVVYLNGIEIYRINMPPGPTTFETLAGAALAEPVVVPYSISLDALTNGNVNPLVGGDNVIAVETASTGTGSSDTVWGMSLYSSLEPCHPLVAVAPTHTNALACRSVKFVATFASVCPGSTYQWHRNLGDGDQPIPGATGTTLTLSNVTFADSGEYYVRTTSSAGSVDSSHSVLIVTADTVGPMILSAEQMDEGDAILITFNEPFLPAARGGTADVAGTWIIWSLDLGGGPVPILSATAEPDNPAQVRLTLGEHLVPGFLYGYETTQPIADGCSGASTPPGNHGYVLLRSKILHWTDGRDWRFNQSGVDQGTAWKELTFDDRSWDVGPQGFGNMTGGFPNSPDAQRTALMVGPSRSTYYFRTRFTVPHAFANLHLRAAVNDGAVAYVNGVEIGRINVPEGPVNFATLVPRMADGQGELPSRGLPIPAQVLRAGENVLAIEVHQTSVDSPDVLMLASITGVSMSFGDFPFILTQPQSLGVVEGRTFALSVTATSFRHSFQWFKDDVAIPGATSPIYSAVADANSGGIYRVMVSSVEASVTSDRVTVIVRRLVKRHGDNWKYQIEGQDSSPAVTPWYAVDFDDTAWPSAPGPFGVETTAATLARIPSLATPLPSPSSNRVATYFRSMVTIPNLTNGEGLFLTHMVDDGAAFYVDGNLAFTYNLNDRQPIRAGVLTPESVPGDGDARETTIPVTLPPGTHWLAVEVHQDSPTSSDVVFGTEITRGPALPRLNIDCVAPNVVQLTWTPAVGVRLFSAAAAHDVFTAVPSNPQGRFVANFAAVEGVRFFRLGY